jgi:hypothetical protein
MSRRWNVETTVTTADSQALLLDRLKELAAKQDEIHAMLTDLQRPPTGD